MGVFSRRSPAQRMCSAERRGATPLPGSGGSTEDSRVYQGVQLTRVRAFTAAAVLRLLTAVWAPVLASKV